MNRFFEKELNKLARMIDEIDVYKKASLGFGEISSVDFTAEDEKVSLEIKAKLSLKQVESVEDLSAASKGFFDEIFDSLKATADRDVLDNSLVSSSPELIKTIFSTEGTDTLVTSFFFTVEYFEKVSNEKLQEAFEECFKGAKVTERGSKAQEEKSASIYNVSKLYRQKYASKMFSVDMSDYTAQRPQYVGDALFKTLMALYYGTEKLFSAVETSNAAAKSPDVKIPLTLDRTSAMGLLGMAMKELFARAYDPTVSPQAVKRHLETIRTNFNKVYYMAKELNDPMSFMDPKDAYEGAKAWKILQDPAGGNIDNFNRLLTESEKALSTFKPKPKYKAPAPATTSRPAAPAKSAPSAELETKDSYLSYLQQGNSPEQIATSIGTMGEVAAFKEALEEHYSEPSLTDEEKENIKSVYYSLES